MRVLILTSKERGIAGSVLRALHNTSAVTEVAALLCGLKPGPKDLAWMRRRVRKVRRIGFVGALNGIRLRSWFDYGNIVSLPETAAALGVAMMRAPHVNSDESSAHVRDWVPDVMISLSNPIIRENVFKIPKFGTINYHGELLPEYPGAQSVLWPIYFGLCETGYSIHKITAKLDGGEILLRKSFPIQFCPELKDTIAKTGAQIQATVPKSFADLLSDWDDYWDRALPNVCGRPYTTPTAMQFLKMVRNNRRQYELQTRVRVQ